VCKEATSSGEDTSASLGTYTIEFKENCESSGRKCRSLGDANGFILTGGTYFIIVWDSLRTLGVAILFLPNELHLECARWARVNHHESQKREWWGYCA